MAAFNCAMMENQVLGQQLHFCGRSNSNNNSSIDKNRWSNKICKRSVAVRAFGGEAYNTLGIRPGSSKLDVKKAYRQLALKYHPDVCKGDQCTSKFLQITAAYESVMNETSNEEQDEQQSYDDDEEQEGFGGWEGAWYF